MKRIICLAVGLMFCLAGIARADRYGLNKTEKELSDFLWGMGYNIVSVSTAPVGTTASYTQLLGFGTDLHAYYVGNSKITLYLSTSTVSGGFEIPLVSGQNYEQSFYVPISSPTVIRYSIAGGTTLQVTVGGLKK